MTTVFNLREARNQLSSLVERAASGEEIIIAKNGRPMAKLVPLPQERKEPRKPSGSLGLTYMADDFDAPLSAIESGPREPSGALKIKRISPDFDDPLPPELLKLFGYDT